MQINAAAKLKNQTIELGFKILNPYYNALIYIHSMFTHLRLAEKSNLTKEEKRSPLQKF